MRNFSIQAIPDGDGNVLGCGNAGGKVRDFEIEVAMVVYADHFALEYIFQLLQINHKSGHWVDFASDGHLESVVMTMPVAVGALPEDALILCLPDPFYLALARYDS